MKIRNKITCALLSVSLIAIVLVSVVSFYFARDALIKANGRHLLSVMSAQKNYLRHVLYAWKSEIALITSRTQLRLSFAENLKSSDSRHIMKMEKVLFDAVKASKAIKKIEMCDLAGNLRVAVGNLSLVYLSCDGLVKQNQNDVVIKDIWMSDDKEIYALITETAYLKGKPIGHIRVFVSAHDILDITQNYTGLGETSEVLIAERTAEGHARFLTPLRYDSNVGLLRTTSKDKANVPINLALEKKKEELLPQTLIDYRGELVLAAVAYIPEMDWGMVVKIDRNEALAPIRALFISSLISSLFVFLLIVTVGLYIGRAVTGPVLRFVEKLKHVQGGDFSQKIELSSRDEIGYLAGSFNDMLDSLAEKSTQLEESEMRQRAIVDSMVDGLITINEHGHIESVNPACQIIFGYSAEEVMGQNINMLMPEPYRSEHDEYLKNYHDTGTKKIIGIEREVEGQHKDGRIFPVNLSVSEVNLKEQTFYSGIVRDISERKAALEEIKQTNAELEEFAYRTSHDLRSPLVSSIGLLEIAENAIHNDDKKRALFSLAHTQKSLRKLEELIKDILVLTQTKYIDESSEAIDVKALVNAALDKFSHMNHFERLDIQLDFKFPGPLTVKKSRVVLIVENLISNAIKYQDVEKGKSFIKISTHKEGDNFVFCVRDNGLGVPENQQENLFQMFKRFHPRTSFGSGLGLYMVKKSANILGGQVGFEDSGDGTVFTLKIPVYG